MTESSLPTDRPATRLATRLSFLAAGFGMACWAPLVPYAKARLGLDEAGLGLLLLCLGIGSVAAMPLTGGLIGRWGCRRMILLSGIGLCCALPLLAIVANVPALALTLLLFGASLGTMDVAMNVHAVEVERDAAIPLMSGFHGLFSVGGFAGAGGMTALLAMGLPPAVAAIMGVGVVAAAVAIAVPRLLHVRSSESGPFFVLPHGIVLLLGALSFTTFLTEGAILDWAALLLTEFKGFETAEGGLAYTVFSLAMTAGRLTGDRVVHALGPKRVLLWGGLGSVAGFAVLLLSALPALTLFGFLMIGLGASNLVPVLFSAAGRQRAMPVGLAVAAMTTVGYTGILAGPALMGFVAHVIGLPAAFAVLALLMLSVPLAARAATR